MADFPVRMERSGIERVNNEELDFRIIGKVERLICRMPRSEFI